MKALIRSLGVVAATVGLVVAFAPDAGATPACPHPTVETLAFATGSEETSPCDGSLVSTSGTGFAVTSTSGTHTTVGFVDKETGDGYVFLETFTGKYDSLSTSYSGEGEGLWINKDPALTFHASLEVVMSVTSTNAPTGVASTTITSTCGF